MPTIHFRITDLTCAACVKLSTMALTKISGVKSATVDLATGSVEMEAVHEVAWDEIAAALLAVGKHAVI